MNASDHNKIDPKIFWDEKIIQWEMERYDGDYENSSWLEKIANNASISLRYRLELSKKILAANCAGKSIVEIGCGTSRLAGELIEAGAEHYHGFDISSAAIETAIARAARAGLGDQVSYSVAGIDALPELNGDIVFSLGLMDWLNDDEINLLLSKSGRGHCLHSISERRLSVPQLIHRAYVHIAYGHRSCGYVPRYLDAEWLASIVEKNSGSPAYVIRDPRLSFGAFVTTLSNDQQTSSR